MTDLDKFPQGDLECGQAEKKAGAKRVIKQTTYPTGKFCSMLDCSIKVSASKTRQF
jgi:hypothetical protein